MRQSFSLSLKKYTFVLLFLATLFPGYLVPLLGVRRKTPAPVFGGDGIPVELFQILKDDAVKVLHSTCQQIWKTPAVATGLEKVSFHSNPKERQCQRMLKLLHNCTHFTR